MVRSMFTGEIKIDTNVSLKKKVVKFGTKPRTILFQGGGDDVSTTAFAKIDPATNSNILMVGTIALKIPSPEAKPDEVRPTFRTPCVA